MQYTLSPESRITGTSRQGEVWIAPARLVEMFGEPGGGDGYKVSGRYRFVGEDGSVVTLYDWKSTSLYDGGPSPSSFWASTRRENFSVGAHDSRAGQRFVRWLCARGARDNAAGL